MGLGLNISGMADGYQGYKAEQRRLAEDERKAAADAQAVKDHAFAEDTRNRQRYEWSETDRKLADTRASNAAYEDSLNPPPASAVAAPADSAAVPAQPGTPAEAAAPLPDPNATGMTTAPVPDPADSITPIAPPLARQAAPLDASLAGAPQAVAVPAQAAAAPAAPAAEASPPPAPPVAPVVGGIPKPRVMGNMIDMLAHSLDAAARNGDVNAEAYVKTRAFLDHARNEGVIQALDAWDRGDYAGGLALYNGIGKYNGAVIAANPPPQDAVATLPGGQQVPTHIFTVQNADGSRAVINTALDRYKLIGLKDQLDMQTKATTATAQAQHYRDTGKAALQQANTMEGYRKDQAKNQAEANRVRETVGLAKKTGNGPLDQKAVDAAIELNAQLYTYQQDGAEKPTVLPAARSLYGNMIMKLGDADEAYRVMTTMKAEALAAATNAKGVVDPALFLKTYDAKVAAADARLRAHGTPAPAAAPAAVPAPGKKAAAVPPARTPTAPVAAPTDAAMMEQWVKEKLVGTFDGPAKYAEIAKTHPNPAVRKAAAALYARAQAEAADSGAGADRAL